MNKAEDKATKKALEKFPILFSERMGYDKTNLQQERRNAYEKGYHQAEKDVAEAFARIIRGNLSGIGNGIQNKFEQLYTDITGEKMYKGYID